MTDRIELGLTSEDETIWAGHSSGALMRQADRADADSGWNAPHLGTVQNGVKAAYLYHDQTGTLDHPYAIY